MKCWGMLLVLFINLGGQVSAQDAPIWKPLHVQDMRAIIPRDVYTYALAPNGTTVAWFEDKHGLCVLRLEVSQTTCVPLPNSFEWMPTRLVWSPDSTRIAFTEDLQYNGEESDLWFFDVTAKTFTNRTDDGITGNDWLVKAHSAPQDFLPIWSPVSDDVYFFRVQAAAEENMSLALYRLLPAGNPQLVGKIADHVILWTQTHAAIAADGTTIAFTVPNYEPDNPFEGIWRMQLNNGKLEEIASPSNLRVGFPGWYDTSGVLPSDFAAIDGGWVVDLTDNTYAPAIPHNVVYLNPGVHRIAPLFGLSDLPTQDKVYEVDKHGQVPADIIPMTGAISAQNHLYFYFHRDSSTKRDVIAALPLPMDRSHAVFITDKYDIWCNSTLLLISGKWSDGRDTTDLVSFAICGGE